MGNILNSLPAWMGSFVYHREGDEGNTKGKDLLIGDPKTCRQIWRIGSEFEAMSKPLVVTQTPSLVLVS